MHWSTFELAGDAAGVGFGVFSLLTFVSVVFVALASVDVDEAAGVAVGVDVGAAAGVGVTGAAGLDV